MENVLTFLRKLKENNNKEWFTANKPEFTAAKETFETLVAEVIGEISSIDRELSGLDPKKCIFRIYRDIRFSPDKTPYKTNFGAFFNQGGKKSMKAGYYLHIEPGNSFLGGGIWMPHGNILKAIRQEIFYNVEEFKKITGKKEFNDYYTEFAGDKLQRPPVGFPKDFPDIDLLKFKNYAVGHVVDDKVIKSDGLVLEIVKAYKILQPFNAFLNRSIYTVAD
jgi:uncharacterized protein (TIGR02453 family)